MAFFQNTYDEEVWKKKKTLSSFEVLNLKNVLGPDTSFVLNKRQIAERASSNYKTVAENVKNNLEKLGISLEAWESCNTFPPAISGRIIDMLG